MLEVIGIPEGIFGLLLSIDVEGVTLLTNGSLRNGLRYFDIVYLLQDAHPPRVFIFIYILYSFIFDRKAGI